MLQYAGIFQPPPEDMSVAPTVNRVFVDEKTGTIHALWTGGDITAGDLLIFFTASDGGSAQEATTAEIGWTKIESFSGTDTGCAVFKKKSTDGSEGNDWMDFASIAAVYMSGQCYRIQTWSGDIDDVAVVTSPTTATSATPSPPALTSGFGAVPTLWICGVGTSSVVTLTSGPSGYTTIDGPTPNASRGQMRTAWRTSTAAIETPGFFTLSAATEWNATTIAVRGTG